MSQIEGANQWGFISLQIVDKSLPGANLVFKRNRPLGPRQRVPRRRVTPRWRCRRWPACWPRSNRPGGPCSLAWLPPWHLAHWSVGVARVASVQNVSANFWKFKIYKNQNCRLKSFLLNCITNWKMIQLCPFKFLRIHNENLYLVVSFLYKVE